MKLAIREYITPQGKNPFREWLKNLDMVLQARIQARVLRFESGKSRRSQKCGWRGLGSALRFRPGIPVILCKRRGCSGLAPCGWRQGVTVQGYRGGKTLLARL